MIRKLALFLLISSGSAVLFSQDASDLSFAIDAASLPASASGNEPADSPVAEVRNMRPWEIAPFLGWGKGVGDRSDFNFLFGGVEVGKTLTPVLKAGILSGQFQLAGNVMPLWQAYTPAPHIQTFMYHGTTYVAPVGGGTYYGASLTPVIFRWNFLTKSKRVQPWFQGAGGAHLYHPQVSARCADSARDARRDVGVEFFATRRHRDSLFPTVAPLDRSRRECRAHFVGVAGRSQSRRERQHPDPGGIYVLEVKLAE